MDKRLSVGVDIGGSHITSAAIDLKDRKILNDTISEKPVDNKGSAEEIIRSWSEALSETINKAGLDSIRGIGFAMPGPFDYVNGICLIKGVPKYENLYGTNIAEAITNSLKLPRDMPVRFMNDASSFAVGEAWAGEAAGSARSMAITLGTGLGSAFIADNVPVVKGNNIPELGCVYHIKLRDGIADDYFSTRWFTRKFLELTGMEAKGVREVAEEAGNNVAVRSLFEDFGKSLSSFLAPYLIAFDAEVLVIGGNISRAYFLFADTFESGLRNNKCYTEVRTSVLMESAALLGSAYLLDKKFWTDVKDSLQFM